MQSSNATTQITSLRRFVDPLVRWSKRGLVTLLLINIGLLLYYICVGYQADFHSDAAVKNLIAEEIWQTGRFFPSDWNHVNGDLWVVFGHLFILPLLAFFKNGYALHAASGIASSVLILTAAWLISGVASRSLWTRLLFVVIVASGISGVVTEALYGQVSYGSVFYMACFTVYFAWRFLQAEGRGRWTWGGAIAATTMLAFWANPQRAIATYALPIAAATAVYIGSALGRAALQWNPRATRGVLLLLLIVMGAVVGSTLHQWIIAGVHNAPGAGNARWLTFDGLIKNAGYTLQGMLSVLGGVPTATRSVMSVAGLYEGIRFLGCCSLLVLMPITLARALRGHDDGTRFVSVFAIVSLSLFVFLYMTTTIPDMTDPVTTARYLVPAVLLTLLLVVVVVMDSTKDFASRILGGAGLLVLVTSVFSPNNPLSRGLTGHHGDPRKQLIALLESNGLEYGYASFWNAGVLSVLSDESVRVRQISMEQGIPVPRRHLSSDRWYYPSAWTGKTFLLLSDPEISSVNWGLLTTYAGQPIQSFRYNEFSVYVFRGNLAAVLPNWSGDLKKPLVVQLSSSTQHTAGKYVGGGIGAGGIVTVQGESGYLHFGPYLRLTPGHYRATFRIEATGTPGERLGTIDVTSQQGAKIHAFRDVFDSATQPIELEFSLDTDVADLELRVFASGAGELKLRGISLAKQR